MAEQVNYKRGILVVLASLMLGVSAEGSGEMGWRSGSMGKGLAGMKSRLSRLRSGGSETTLDQKNVAISSIKQGIFAPT